MFPELQSGSAAGTVLVCPCRVNLRQCRYAPLPSCLLVNSKPVKMSYAVKKYFKGDKISLPYPHVFMKLGT